MLEHIVLDTNIWISGLLWRGASYRCLQLAYAGLVQPVYCSEMLSELTDKLRSSFGFNENRIQKVAYDLRRISIEVAISETCNAVVDDPSDNKFVDCAISGGASYIVSNDKHLLALGTYRHIKIVTASDYLLTYLSNR